MLLTLESGCGMLETESGGERAMEPTILDIARLAGVSKSTVSRVLSGGGAVSPESRDKVERAARALDYKPDAIAQAMKTRKTRTLAFVLCGNYRSLVTDPFYAGILDAVISQTDALGYDLILGGGNASVERILQKKIDGALLASYVEPALLQEFHSREVPVVLVNMRVEDAAVGSVVLEDYDSVREQMEYLFGLGHRHIAFISGPLESYSHAERYRAYCDALAAHGCAVDSRLIKSAAAGTGREITARGHALMEELLPLYPAFSAVLATSDSMAAGALRAIRRAGLRTPQEIAVMGYDDLELAEITQPALSTYAVDRERLGREAVDLLVQLIDGHAAPRCAVIRGGELIIREST